MSILSDFMIISINAAEDKDHEEDEGSYGIIPFIRKNSDITQYSFLSYLLLQKQFA